MKVYFKNLNGIRFFAAALVLFHHSFFFTSSFDPHGHFLETCLRNAGRLGVNIFFVLSGFLISYFLLTEKDQTNTISYKTFYIKRILRIWPLYFAVGLPITLLSPWALHALGLATTVNTSDLITNLIYLLFFAINIQFVFATNRYMFEIGWSVCVEEQFYLVWPILINNFRKRINVLIYAMFSFSIMSRIFIYFILPMISHVSEEKIMLYNYVLVFTKFDLFTTGLLIALIYSKKEEYKKLLQKFFHPLVQYIMLVLALLYTFSVIRLTSNFGLVFFDTVICSVLFGYVLLAAIYENPVFNLENKLLVTLGKISYGIYLYHTSIAQLLLMLFEKVIKHKGSRLIYDVAYPITTLVVVCIVSYISYYWFEVKFLKLANKFKPGAKKEKIAILEQPVVEELKIEIPSQN